MSKLLLFIVALSISLSCQAQKPLLKEFPPYAEIVDKLLDSKVSYSAMGSRMTKKIDLQKKREGYWVTIQSYNYDTNSFEEKATQLFWSEKKGYQKITFETDAAAQETITERDLKVRPREDASIDHFNIHPFYNYKGWEEDVIDYYDRNDLTAEQYYSLGRAYSSIASALSIEIGNAEQTMMSDKDKEEKLADLSTRLDQAAASFKQCHELKPEFETIVGRIYTKYCNEIITKFMNIGFFRSKEQTVACVKGKELYTEATLTYAKNILESCPKNSILFTYGDNDTYPLLYLQYAKNFRSDILIVNISFLVVHYYIDHLRDEQFYKKPFPLDVSKELYAGEKSNFVPLVHNNTNEVFFPIKKISEILKKEHPSGRPAPIPSNKLQLSGPDNQHLTLECEGNYLYKNDLFILWMLEANKGKRSVCFTSTFGFGRNETINRIGLSKHLHLSGLSYHLRYGYTSGNSLTNINVDENFEIMQSKLTWLKKMPKVASEDRSLFQMYKYSHSLVLRSLIENGEKEKATEMLEDFFEIFEQALENIEAHDALTYADIFFKIGNLKRGQEMIQTLLNIMKSKEKLTTPDYQAIKFLETILDRENINKFDGLLEEINNIPRERNY